MTTYTWTIQELSTRELVGEDNDYVISSLWSLTGNSTIDGTDYSASANGRTDFVIDPLTPPKDYTDYYSLTEEQVLGWIFDTLGPTGVADKQAFVDSMLVDMATPSPVVLPLPWTLPPSEGNVVSGGSVVS